MSIKNIYFDDINNDFDPKLYKSEMSITEIRFMLKFLKENKPLNIVEIGVSAGGTTSILLKNITDNQHLYSIDTNIKHYKNKNNKTGYIIDDVCTQDELKRHTMWLGIDIVECVDKIQGGIDFLILDTVHALPGEFLQFIAALPYMNKNSICVLHDIALNREPFTEKNAIYRMHSFCTALLFSVVKSNNKFYTMNAPNISAFFVDSMTIDNSDDIIMALSANWFYYPSNLNLYTEFIKKYYSDFFFDHWNTIISYQHELIKQRNICVTINKQQYI